MPIILNKSTLIFNIGPIHHYQIFDIIPFGLLICNSFKPYLGKSATFPHEMSLECLKIVKLVKEKR